MLGQNLRKRVVKNENLEKWNCWGDWTGYRSFPVLFKAHGGRQLIWGACSKLGENRPHNKYFEAESQLYSQPRMRILPIGYIKD